VLSRPKVAREWWTSSGRDPHADERVESHDGRAPAGGRRVSLWAGRMGRLRPRASGRRKRIAVLVLVTGCLGLLPATAVAFQYGGWTQESPAGETAIAAGSDGTQMLMDGGGQVWAKYGVGNGGWIQETPAGQAFRAIATNGGVQMILDGAGQIWAKSGVGNGGWLQESPPGENRISAGGSGLQMLLDGGGQVWAETPQAVYANTLHAGQALQAGEQLISPDGQYQAIMQPNGDFVFSGPAGSWDTGTDGNPGANLSMQADGNLVIYSASGQVLWSTETEASANDSLAVANGGALTLSDGSGSELWGVNLTSPLAGTDDSGALQGYDGSVPVPPAEAAMHSSHETIFNAAKHQYSYTTSDTTRHFGANVNRVHPNAVNWVYWIRGTLLAIATGKVQEGASLWNLATRKQVTSYGDNHSGSEAEYPGYAYHSTIPNLAYNTDYQLAVNVTGACIPPPNHTSCDYVEYERFPFRIAH
jgi:hypothetical protein